MKFKKEVSNLEKTLTELESKLSLDFTNNKVSVESANSIADMISEAKLKLKKASDINIIVNVRNVIQKIKCII